MDLHWDHRDPSFPGDDDSVGGKQMHASDCVAEGRMPEEFLQLLGCHYGRCWTWVC